MTIAKELEKKFYNIARNEACTINEVYGSYLSATERKLMFTNNMLLIKFGFISGIVTMMMQDGNLRIECVPLSSTLDEIISFLAKEIK